MAFPTLSEMKPETRARVVAAHAKAKADRSADLTQRLKEAVAKHGPDSIYAEMLAERERDA